MTPPDCDVLIVGAGLAGSLTALNLRRARPDLRVMVLEQGEAAGEGHTWCLFETDVSAAGWAALVPLLDHVWSGYTVAFPAHARDLPTRYGCLSGGRLARTLEAALGADLRRGVTVARLTPAGAVGADGAVWRAPLVVDARGGRPSPHLELAYQKFVGVEVTLERPHGLTRPIVMDATVPQRDGFRFLYTLPLGADRLLVEDTRYSAGPSLNVGELAAEALAYAAWRRWPVAREVRREKGVLPVLLGGDLTAVWDDAWREAGGALPLVGLRGGFFHPTTGYSFAEAVAVAEVIAQAPTLTSPAIGALLRNRALRLWRERGIYRAVNRIMFLAAEPDRRYRVLQRFYRLSRPLIERFYGGRLTWADSMRLLSGVPPVPFGRALAALPPSSVRRAHA